MNINFSKESSAQKSSKKSPPKSGTQTNEFNLEKTPVSNAVGSQQNIPSHPGSIIELQSRNIGESEIKIIKTKEIQKIDMDVMDSG